jgi:HSP20 family protein
MSRALESSSRILDDLQAEMNRLFDSVFGRSRSSPAPSSSAGPTWVPALDVREADDEIVVSVELPGVNEKEIQVSISGDILSIKGERAETQAAEPQAYYISECRYGKFERHLELPFPVKTDKVKATYRHGVLTICLPKAAEVKSQEIKIQAA